MQSEGKERTKQRIGSLEGRRRSSVDGAARNTRHAVGLGCTQGHHVRQSFAFLILQAHPTNRPPPDATKIVIPSHHFQHNQRDRPQIAPRWRQWYVILSFPCPSLEHWLISHRSAADRSGGKAWPAARSVLARGDDRAPNRGAGRRGPHPRRPRTFLPFPAQRVSCRAVGRWSLVVCRVSSR